MAPKRPRNALEILLQGSKRHSTEGIGPGQKQPKVDKASSPTAQHQNTAAAQTQRESSHQSCHQATPDPLQRASSSCTVEPDSHSGHSSQSPATIHIVQGTNAFAKLMSSRPAVPANVVFQIRQDAAGNWTTSWTQQPKSTGTKASNAHHQGASRTAGQPATSYKMQASQPERDIQACLGHAGVQSSPLTPPAEPPGADQLVWEAQVKLQLPEDLLTQTHASAASQKNPCSFPTAGVKQPEDPPKLRQAVITLRASTTQHAAGSNGLNWANLHMQSNQQSGRTYHGSPALLKSALQKCVRRGLADQAVRYADDVITCRSLCRSLACDIYLACILRRSPRCKSTSPCFGLSLASQNSSSAGT